ncbi:dihydrofolate reductase family protein [Micromonospora ureilytica]|uniref:dihydrofolate reductase family protein n=1 Tax=Micromonospora ureilytica TaxID=709868 RepID=UPI002E11AD12|nr:dihydrofolate reductase family protein [Micromonospora ureilytica]
MGKLQYQCSMSLDGFIAGPDGDMSWLADDSASEDAETDTSSSESSQTNELVKQVGAVLSGNRTYRGDDPNAGTEKEGGYEGQYTGPTFVVTHHVPKDSEPDVTFVDNLEKAISLAKEAAGDKLVSVLGANVAKQCIELGVLDEILVYITPVLLGDGVRLFDHPGGSLVKLEILEAGKLSVHGKVVY